MKKSLLAAAVLPLLAACQGLSSGTPDDADKGGRQGPAYISALQSDPAGAESEGGQGWVELILTGAAQEGEWCVRVSDGSSVSQMMTSGDFAALPLPTAGGATFRLHPYSGYAGPDDAGKTDAGWDGKVDYVCAASSGCGSLPAGGGFVWIEDSDGNVTDFLRYGGESSCFDEGEADRALSSAVSSGEWPFADAAVTCDSSLGYLRLTDRASEGNAPSQWMVCGEPSFTYVSHFELSPILAAPSSAARGETVMLSCTARGAAGADVTSVIFDFSSVTVDAAHRGEAAVLTLPASADGSYSCAFPTDGVAAGSYDIPVSVTGTGAEPVTGFAKISVREKPVIVLGAPAFSFAPSTATAPGKKFTLSVPVTATGTDVSGITLSCAALALAAEGTAGADGNAVFSLDSTGWAEGTYALAVTAAGGGAEDASASAMLAVQSPLCVEGGDMESDIADPSSMKPSSTGYVTAGESPGNVHGGQRSLHISGTGSSNGYVFTSKLPCADKGGFSKIVFFVKGAASGKSLSVNVWTGAASYKSFNLGTVNADKAVVSSGSNSYAGSIYAPEWVKISLDISSLVPSGPIGFKFGSSGAYDLYLDDIVYE